MGFQIGTVKIEGKTVLGPMAGVTDLPFRMLCKEQGAALLYTEMVSAKGIHYNSKNTNALMVTTERERPIALQLFGEDPLIMAEVSKQIEELPFDILDINMGCPVPKVVNNGEGSALMKNPKRIGEIVYAISRSIQKPVTVKLRKGFFNETGNAPECAYIAQESGAACVAVHGRTREQYYSGKADWEVIRKVKEKVSIPVIGNGDVTSPQMAERMIIETGCDAVMIGRGALGNPWVFSQINKYLDEEIIIPNPCREEIKQMIYRHAKALIDSKGEETAMREMRKHCAWYTGGYPNSARLRGRLNEVSSFAELQELLEQHF